MAALLLTWVDAPAAFREMADLQAALEARSQAELIALIRQMLERYPDLETLLELPLPGVSANARLLDPQVIRKQAQHAFGSSNGDWGWGDAYEIERDLQPLLNLAEQYTEQGEHENAATVYQVLAETVLHHEDAVMQDEEGRLGVVVGNCVEGMGVCLEHLSDAGRRQALLKALFDVYAWDMQAGGIGISDEAPGILLARGMSERQMVADWIPAASANMGDWGRRNMGGLQLRLQAETIDDETFLTICRETGRVKDLVDRLLTLGRVDDAASEARQAGDYALLNLADVFEQHQHGPLARTLLLQRAQVTNDNRLLEWLKEYAKRQGNQPEALDWAEKLFWKHPSLPAYVEMRLIALAEEWPHLREHILAKLSEQEKELGLLTEIYLEEGQIDLALAAFEQTKAQLRYWSYGSLQLKVAHAASEARPKEAIRLYMQIIEHLIAQRGRENYAE